MKKKLKSILLIDDSKADLFLHEMVLENANFSEEVNACYGARAALDLLARADKGEVANPDLILLDINMPGMSGWDFLDEYLQLKEAFRANIQICMLTTSEAESDKVKAKGYEVVKGYLNKPLMTKELEKMMEKI